MLCVSRYKIYNCENKNYRAIISNGPMKSKLSHICHNKRDAKCSQVFGRKQSSGIRFCVAKIRPENVYTHFIRICNALNIQIVILFQFHFVVIHRKHSNHTRLTIFFLISFYLIIFFLFFFSFSVLSTAFNNPSSYLVFN